MSQPNEGGSKRGWALAILGGGVVIILFLSFALTGSAGSGQGPVRSAHSKDPATATCTQYQKMVGLCAEPTTTTSTGTSGASDPPANRGSDGGSTTYYSNKSAPPSPTAPVPSSPSAPAARPNGPTQPPASSSQCSGTTPPVPVPAGSWHCTLDDEFNGTSLDTSKWSVMTTFGSAYTTGPLGHRVCYIDSPQTVSESGGYLNLSIVKVPQTYACRGTLPITNFGTDYVGGEVISYQKFTQKYGYFQVRSSLPPTNVPGLQETLWLYPENWNLYGPWPDSGEIDFAEFYSNYPNNDIPAIHYPGAEKDPNSTSYTCTIPGQSTAGQFHTYALLWTPTTLTTFYDGKTCMTDVYAPYVTNPDTAPQPFDQPFFLTFTAALSAAPGNTPSDKTPLPATSQIDWARVWQYG